MEYNPIQTTPFSLKIKIKSRLWKIVNATLFRYSPLFWRKFRVFLVNIFGGHVHRTCSLSNRSKIDHPWNLTMGQLSSLGKHCWIYCLDKVTIGDKCCIGEFVFILTGSHDTSSCTFDLITKPVEIRSNSWIATGAYILPGIVIGEFCVVGAKSLVTKSINDCSIVGGNPAKFIKKREMNDK